MKDNDVVKFKSELAVMELELQVSSNRLFLFHSSIISPLGTGDAINMPLTHLAS
mgnify:CR=1 FL=1